MSDSDYYKILSLDKNCSEDDIRKAYKKLAIRWHPDKQGNKSDDEKKIAEEKFKKINEAYEILSDSDKRKQYDLLGSNAFKNSKNFGGFRNAHDVFSMFFKNGNMRTNFGNDSDDDDFGNIHFNSMGNNIRFNVRPSFMKFTNNVNGEQFREYNEFGDSNTNKKSKGDDTIIDLNVTLNDLYNGKTKRLRINRKIFMSNNKYREESEIVSVDIKPGYKEGTKITFENKGDKYLNKNQEPGDIIFIIKQIPHDTYTRENNDLITTIEISLSDAKNGFKKIIKDLKNENITINCSKGISNSGYIYKINDKGMPIRKSGEIVGKGNILVKFNIKI